MRKQTKLKRKKKIRWDTGRSWAREINKERERERKWRDTEGKERDE